MMERASLGKALHHALWAPEAGQGRSSECRGWVRGRTTDQTGGFDRASAEFQLRWETANPEVGRETNSERSGRRVVKREVVRKVVREVASGVAALPSAMFVSERLLSSRKSDPSKPPTGSSRALLLFLSYCNHPEEGIEAVVEAID